MKALSALLAPALLCACVTVTAPKSISPSAPQGTPLALGQSVQVGDVTITPTSVVEDSRCPINTRCAWAGRLVVKTHWQIAGWHEVIEMEPGKNFDRHGRGIALSSGEPGKSADRATRPEEYRFTYDRAWYVGTQPGAPLANRR